MWHEENGYPSEAAIERVEHWDSIHDTPGLLAFVKSLWKWPDGYWRQTRRRLYLDTGGWSGNEDLIKALRHNYVFWGVSWVSERRGGHFEFDIRTLMKQGENAVEVVA